MNALDTQKMSAYVDKKVIYHVFTRLFGNSEQNNIPWSTKEINGVGKFSDFTDFALQQIKELGVTHIWYTGVLHHAIIGDYTDIGVGHDHPSIVKGRAGSPYAIKDYFQVNPDLADNAEERMEEFEALIERTHRAGLKVIIDIVPNHVARQYKSLNNPIHANDFGADDDVKLEYHRNNNFYYIPEQSFELPDFPEAFQPLGGSEHPTLTTPYFEHPAKWTGNGSRKAKPKLDDWYETVKINYGVRPDGSKDFPELPENLRNEGVQAHIEFWQHQSLPDSWIKFRDIALFWLDKGVDGFRYDVAELVPVEFWSYLNSTIKIKNPDAFLMAEVYQPDLYRDFIQLGKMDYLYDKVDLYDTLKAIIQNKESVSSIVRVQKELADIEHHMLHFLENHDEQRIASPEFAGNADLARPAMLLSATIGSSPTMVYFGQEVGEPALENAGFGQPSRTSIFDYVSVPHHQRWLNNGAFDGALLNQSEKNLRAFYSSVLNYSISSPALMGHYIDLYSPLSEQLASMKDHVFIFARQKDKHTTFVAVNFNPHLHCKETLIIPAFLIQQLSLPEGTHTFKEQIEQQLSLELKVNKGIGSVELYLPPLAAYAFEL
ncbi:alpha-amylase family protein [Vibrio algarum]|uniref:Alpha-amylase family protein n=1 Tax=Vibrio algarum TaxID=3020714 RepID=A0ABT4YVV0_9VIBR|nr:alpha-amylase family protein [Vibrio sp. KJ40-1]MDB1125686.1 alpha-amylase family protein [Vibrio sp. KJ40-1]